MRLPASGAISIGMAASELGIGLPLSLGDSRVRALAGVPSGPISLGQLRGKSAYTPMTASFVDGQSTGTSDGISQTTATAQPRVIVSGGSGGYTYQWTFTDTGNAVFQAGTDTLAQCSVRQTISRFGYTGTSTLQCLISDNTGHSITVLGIRAIFDWQYNG